MMNIEVDFISVEKFDFFLKKIYNKIIKIKKKNENIYCNEGEKYSGGYILDVFTNRTLAEQYIEKYGKTCNHPLKIDRNGWMCGYKYITIKEYPIHEKLEDWMEQ